MHKLKPRTILEMDETRAEPCGGIVIQIYPVRFEIFLYKLADNSHIAHINCNMMNTHIIIYILILFVHIPHRLEGIPCFDGIADGQQASGRGCG